MNNNENKSENAVIAFNGGLNCAQAVLLAFAREVKLDEKTILTISAAFGAGMARQQMTCGAVTGAYMVLGCILGRKTGSLQERKESVYSACNEFSTQFRKEHSTIVCRDLLGYDMNSEIGKQAIEEQNLFNTICSGCVKTSVDILDQMVNSNSLSGG